jgi:hypothetical protein
MLSIFRTRKRTLINPEPSRKNPALLTIGPLGALNPQRKSTMTKKNKNSTPHKHHKSAHAGKRSKPARAAQVVVHRFPAFTGGKRNKSNRGNHRKTGNPQGGNLLAKPLGILKLSAFAGGGLIATRQLPQILLKEKNTGLIGYGTAAATAAAAGLVIYKTVGKEAGGATWIGSVLYLLARVLNEYLSPVGQFLKLTGVGDAMAANRLGAVVPAAYLAPEVYDRNGQRIWPEQLLSAASARTRADLAQMAAAMAPLPSASSVSGAGGRFSSKY